MENQRIKNVKIEKESDKAILLNDEWLPKSQIKIENGNVEIPGWLVEENEGIQNLIAGHIKTWKLPEIRKELDAIFAAGKTTDKQVVQLNKVFEILKTDKVQPLVWIKNQNQKAGFWARYGFGYLPKDDK